MAKKRRIKNREKLWWFVGLGLYAVAIGIVTAPHVGDYLFGRKDREVDVQIRYVRIKEFKPNVDKILETRTQLSFYGEEARKEPVLLSKVFGGKDYVNCGGQGLSLDRVLSVSYSPDKKRGLILHGSTGLYSKVMSNFSPANVFIFGTSDDLKFRSVVSDSSAFNTKKLEEAFDVSFMRKSGGMDSPYRRSDFGYSNITWAGNDAAIFNIDCVGKNVRTEGFPVLARVDIDRNNVAGNLRKYEAAD